MDLNSSIIRFLYLSTTKSFYIKRLTDITVSDVNNQMSCFREMANADPDALFALIKKVLFSNTLLRKNETIFALAFCVRLINNDHLRIKIFDELHSLLAQTTDFLLFIKYCNTICDPSKGFGRGFRKAIRKWYFSKTGAELSEMLGKNRSIYGWTHKDILTLAHVQFPDPERINIKKLIFKKGIDGIRYVEKKQNPPGAPRATRSPAAADGTAQRLRPLRSFVFNLNTENFLIPFERVEVESSTVELERRLRRQQNQQRLRQQRQRQELPDLPASVLRLKDILSFKICESASDAVGIIQEKNLAFENIPIHLLHYAEVWNAILPKLTYTDILNLLSTMSNLNVLKATDEFAKKLTKKLSSMKLVKQAQLYPLFIYIIKIAYERNKPYVEHIKSKHHKKRVLRNKIAINPNIVKKLNSAFLYSFNHFPSTNLRYCITIDLKQKNLKKQVFGYSELTCFDVFTIMATAYIKREANTLLYTFTAEKTKLKPITYKKNSSFESIKNNLYEELISQTTQNLALPITTVRNQNLKIDVFITLVDSVATFCRRGHPPIEEFNAYRNRVNKAAKYIICNMSRHKPDLIFSNSNTKGFLEICGIEKNTQNLIYVFAKNYFS